MRAGRRDRRESWKRRVWGDVMCGIWSVFGRVWEWLGWVYSLLHTGSYPGGLCMSDSCVLIEIHNWCRSGEEAWNRSTCIWRAMLKRRFRDAFYLAFRCSSVPSTVNEVLVLRGQFCKTSLFHVQLVEHIGDKGYCWKCIAIHYYWCNERCNKQSHQRTIENKYQDRYNTRGFIP